jgi:hypothetical protein
MPYCKGSKRLCCLLQVADGSSLVHEPTSSHIVWTSANLLKYHIYHHVAILVCWLRHARFLLCIFVSSWHSQLCRHGSCKLMDNLSPLGMSAWRLFQADTEPDSWYVHDQRCLGSFEGLTPWPRTPSNPDLETNRLPRIGTVVGIISVFMQLQAVNRIVFLQST